MYLLALGSRRIGEGIEGVVEVVVVEDDFGLDAGLLEGGAEVVADEDLELRLEHEHARSVSSR